MGHAPLVEGQLAEGQRLLDAITPTNLGAELVFWFYDPDREDWNLYVVSTLCATQGLRTAYHVLHQAADPMPPSPWFDPLTDIRIISPDDPIARTVRATFDRYPPIPVARRLRGGGSGSDVYIVDAFVYPRQVVAGAASVS